MDSLQLAGSNLMDGQWDAWEAALLALLGRTELEITRALRRYRLLLAPSFHMPACLDIEESARHVALTLAVLRDSFALEVARIAAWGQRTARRHPSGIAEGHYWELQMDLPSEQQADFRRLCAEVDPWSLEDGAVAGIDGISLWLQCMEPGRAHTIHMWSPTRERTPAHHRWVTAVLDLAAHSAHGYHCGEYLLSLQPYLAD
jgi:hypothetical protein